MFDRILVTTDDSPVANLALPPAADLARREANGQPVAAVIADEVGRGGDDLVVMSTHGRSGLAHFFLGSVAEAVLRQVSVPIFLVRAPAGLQEKTRRSGSPPNPDRPAINTYQFSSVGNFNATPARSP